MIISQGCQIAQKATVELLLAAVGALICGFGALYFIGLLFETPQATTLGNLCGLFAADIFVIILQNHSRFKQKHIKIST